MEQEDFRKLLSSNTARAEDSSLNKKRPRDRAFASGRQGSSSSTTSFLAPRTKRSATSSTTTLKPERASRVTADKPMKSLLADGYTDRTRQRQQESSKDEDQDKLDQLKDDLKHKRITHREYLKQVEGFAKGEFSQSGLVRGLDRKLLERVRAGEDVLGVRDDGEVAKTEEELDQALDKLEWKAKDEGRQSEPAQHVPSSTTSNTRDAILARMKQSKSANPDVTRPNLGQATSSPAFIPITKRNKDGTTTESFMENGKKVKIIRDETGKVIKKLVKKAEQVETEKPESKPESKPVNATRDVPHTDNAPTVPDAVLEDQSFEDGGDIFDDVGEYDPYSGTVAADKDQGTDNDGRRNYFASGAGAPDMAGEVGDEDVPASTKDFLKQNRAALEAAARIVDAQERKKQDQLAAKQKRDAGFGLVFADSDAYAGDLREVPEDDEIYDKRRDGHRRSTNQGAKDAGDTVE